MIGRGPFFHLPQPVPPEQNAAPDVERVLRDHTAFTSRMLRREMREIRMRLSELSTKVDQLISAATSIKQTADGQSAQAANIPEDDPEIASMAARIDSAIAILQGNSPAATSSADPGVNPNAPVV